MSRSVAFVVAGWSWPAWWLARRAARLPAGGDRRR